MCNSLLIVHNSLLYILHAKMPGYWDTRGIGTLAGVLGHLGILVLALFQLGDFGQGSLLQVSVFPPFPSA